MPQSAVCHNRRAHLYSLRPRLIIRIPWSAVLFPQCWCSNQ